jgi:hypothetical protein
VKLIERQLQILRMLKKAGGHTRQAPGAPRRTSFPGEATGMTQPEDSLRATLRIASIRERSMGKGAFWRAGVGRVKWRTFSTSVREFYG